ncbi:MAG: CAP domain-containing protein [Intestinibacillus sp.]
MKKMKRIAMMTACAALAGTVSAGAACLPQNTAAAQAKNACASGSTNCVQSSKQLQSAQQALNKLCQNGSTLSKQSVRQALNQLCGGSTCTTGGSKSCSNTATNSSCQKQSTGTTTTDSKTTKPSQPSQNSNSGGSTDTTTPSTPSDTTDTGSNAASSYAAEVVRLVNVEREKAGLSALTIDSKTQAAAQTRAAELQQSFSHTRPNGSSPFTALAEAGVSYKAAGENIAMGQKTPAEVVNAWMNSSGHRANILGSQFTSIGVGYVTGSNGYAYWAQEFIG